MIGLDGLRGIAVLLVLIDHGFGVAPTMGLSYKIWAPGAIGVRAFFVLSGFLITSILLRAKHSSTDHTRVVCVFYLRRLLRIFPPALACIGISWLLHDVGARTHLWWYLTYTSNLLSGWQGSYDRGLGHLWTVGIEEQFYLIWPVALMCTPTRLMPKIAIGVITLASMSRGSAYLLGGPIAASTFTLGRLDALAVGAWLAWARMADKHLAVGLAAIGLSLTAATISVSPWDVSRVVLAELGAVLLTAVLVDVIARRSVVLLDHALSNKWLVQLGTISYAVYLIHPILLADVFPEMQPGVFRFALMSGASIAIAEASWYFMEKRLIAYGHRFDYVRETPESSATIRP